MKPTSLPSYSSSLSNLVGFKRWAQRRVHHSKLNTLDLGFGLFRYFILQCNPGFHLPVPVSLLAPSPLAIGVCSVWQMSWDRQTNVTGAGPPLGLQRRRCLTLAVAVSGSWSRESLGFSTWKGWVGPLIYCNVGWLDTGEFRDKQDNHWQYQKSI